MHRVKRKLGDQIRRELEIWRVGSLPGLLVIALIVLVRITGHLQFFEWVALDYLLRYRPVEPVDERILIVGIDEQDILAVQDYPIPDGNLAELLTQLAIHRPNVIGLDIVRDIPTEQGDLKPGYSALADVFTTNKNIVGIERLYPVVNSPPAFPSEQVGFADLVSDSDGNLRRSLAIDRDGQGVLKFSLSTRLAETYLASKGFALQNGIYDKAALRFGSVEFPRFRPNSGGYVGEDAWGSQLFLNFRSGDQPFRVVSLREVMAGKVPAEWIRDRIILIGMTAASLKDTVKTTATASGVVEISGVEIHAHAVSQMVSAVLDGRSLLNALSEEWEYVWIVAWGLLGIALGRIILSPFKALFSIGIISVLLVGSCYGMILLGWWVPLVPALLVFMLNSAGLTASLFYRYQQDLQARVQARQAIIDQTFNAIHNGPLQILAGMLREMQQEPLSQTYYDLNRLNQELRTINEFMRREALVEGSHLYLSGGQEVDLQTPLHETLYEIYDNTLSRTFPHFKTIYLRIPDFSSMNEQFLTLAHKRSLCRFLEEALCNVGKHAKGVSQLEVVCKQELGKNVIRVTDNGVGIDAQPVEGLGTQQAKILARQLRGTFRRSPHLPKGTVCELSWSATKRSFRG